MRVRRIKYGRQRIDRSDRKAVAEVLRSDWLTQGPYIERFERQIAEHVEAKFAVAFSSASAALHGAAWTLGLGPRDLGITSPLTFVASTNAFRHVGARVGVVDITQDSWNLDLRLIPEKATAVMPVHFAGLPVNLEKWEPSGQRPKVIEDASHALGAITPSGPVGNCAHSDVTCFSFHPVKPITTGEGGIAVTQNYELFERLRRFRNHGIIRDRGDETWQYEIAEEGFNYRMSDIHAALGLSQLKKLQKFVSIRNEQALFYRDRLSALGIGLPPLPQAGFLHGYHLFPVLLQNRDFLFREMRRRGIGVQVHYVPVNELAVNQDMNTATTELPVTQDVYSKILSLPIHPGLSQGDLNFVVAVLEELHPPGLRTAGRQ